MNKRASIPNLNLVSSLKGRPLVQAPNSTSVPQSRKVSPPLVEQPGRLRFGESASRELEKLEAHSIREALEQIDHGDDETRIYTAAQQEAADLVWRHMNPNMAEHEKTMGYKNPDLARKRESALSRPNRSSIQHNHTASDESTSSDVIDSYFDKPEGLRLTKRGSRDGLHNQQTSDAHNSRRRSSSNRNVSNGSAKGVFRNPEDQIYEEPEEIEKPIMKPARRELPLQSRQRNSLPRGSRPLPEKPHTVPLPEKTKFDRFEIHRNTPSQSRKAEYTANESTSREATPEVETPKGRAMEIRSDEIRAATSKQRKDRSPKLPTPTAVSDRPGRPIVSFDPTWRPDRESPRSSIDVERPTLRPAPVTSAGSHSAPVVPTLNLPEDDIPSINVTEDVSVPSISVSTASSVPTINLPDDPPQPMPGVPTISLPDDPPAPRPLPQINVNGGQKPGGRPLPSHTQSSPSRLPPSGRPVTNRVPWLSRAPTAAGATVTCNACQLPISGRIVTASGSAQSGLKVRFHPECFTCFHCSTALECVSFYPEPESSQTERLQHDPEADPTEMRFYCHLDFHDLFSPRCASCKTPIEGAVILAAGKSWHEGHFFCAECGDPFSSSSPFVEDKGYAYCVSCHTKRTSARCRACKKQILDEVSVEALGGKWHEECFCCDQCGGDFGEDGRFYVREVEVELTDKEKRKGFMQRKFEDRAVCQMCEELRLKNQHAFL